VQLPKGMPKDIMHVLKKARVRQQPMGLELSDEQVKRAPRPPVSYTHLTLPTNREV